MVVVLVGPEKQCFEIHKALICSRSDFFKAAFTGNFKEADGTLTLPEDDPATFKHFVHWIYTDSLRGLYYSETVNPTMKELTDKVRSEVISQNLLHVEELSHTNAHRKLWEHANYRDLPLDSLIAVYILADKLQVPRLKDAAITALVEVYGSINSTNSDKVHRKEFWITHGPSKQDAEFGLRLACKTLPMESNLCQVLLHLYCDNTNGVSCPCEEEYIHLLAFGAAMSGLFANRWRKNLQATEWTQPGAICSYHEHEGASCDLSEKYLEDRKAMARRD